MAMEKEIMKQLREVRKEMRANSVRQISCFNGGLSPEEYRLNSLLFALKMKLERSRS